MKQSRNDLSSVFLKSIIETYVFRVKQYFEDENQLKNLLDMLVKSTNDEQFRNVLFSLLTNLCAEKNIRLIFVNQMDLFEILIEDFQRNNQLSQLNLLGLVINLTNDKSQGLENFANQVNNHFNLKYSRKTTLCFSLMINF